MNTQYGWNLSHFFSSPKDPRIEKDIQNTENACKTFEKKYRKVLENAVRKNDLKNILLVLSAYEKLLTIVAAPKSMVYLHLARELNSADALVEEVNTRLEHRLTNALNSLLFFHLLLGKMPVKNQKKILSDKRFAHYRYFLEQLFRESQHDLTESEERILNFQSLPSYGMWISGSEKLLNKQEIVFKKKTYPLQEALSLIQKQKTPQDRKQLSTIIHTRLKSIADFSESELNAIVTNKKITDELRGYKKPYSATVASYQNTEKEVDALVDEVTKSFSIAHDFFSLHKKLLGLPELSYEDRNVPIGLLKQKFTFDDSVRSARDVFASLNPVYASILDRFVAKRQIDVYPRKNKSGGAFCSSNVDVPTYVLLNHVDTIDSYSTLVHEMGHAIHAERSKQQPLIYQGHPISSAEVASTLFESISTDYLLNTLPKKEQIIVLHDKLQADVATIFRQVAFFNFEVDLHAQVRARGYIQQEEIAKLYATHLKTYLGPSVEVDPLLGYGFVYVSHFRRFFYVYAYAYGLLIAKAIAKKFKENKEYAKEIDVFLSHGESLSPSDIFRKIGINTTDGSVFHEGLQQIRDDIGLLKQLAKEEKMI